MKIRHVVLRPDLGPKEWPNLAPDTNSPAIREEVAPYEPTIAELAENFGAAMARVIVAKINGRRVKVTEEEYRQRDAACSGCPYWNPKGNFGFGRCGAPGCGCTRFKRWLLTETCKHPKGPRWPAISG